MADTTKLSRTIKGHKVTIWYVHSSFPDIRGWYWRDDTDPNNRNARGKGPFNSPSDATAAATREIDKKKAPPVGDESRVRQRVKEVTEAIAGKLHGEEEEGEVRQLTPLEMRDHLIVVLSQVCIDTGTTASDVAVKIASTMRLLAKEQPEEG